MPRTDTISNDKHTAKNTDGNNNMSEIIKIEQIENKILHIRNQNVMLDSDIAELYGVETMRINEAVKNNPEKFPAGYIFELNKNEKTEVIENFDNLKIKFSPALPKAFTEKGLYMLATILKSKRATETTIEIIETFAKMRELSRTVAKLPDEENEKKQKSLMQRSGELITELFGKDMQKTDSETSIEFNLAMVKVKHSIKQKAQNATDITLQLKTAKKLLEAGTLTSQEFEKLKEKILK
jgi:phage regulator Rha-like protein